MARPIPFDLALDALPADRLADAMAALAADKVDLADRDAVLLHRAAVSLLHDLRPENGLGDAAEEFVAFLHHALAWHAAGRVLGAATRDALTLMLAERPADDVCTEGGPRYIQLPVQRVWGRPVPDEPHEPLDGLHLLPQADGTLRVLACFGVHEQRAGLTVVEAAGPRSGPLARADGSPLFAPQLPGGAAAGLHELLSPDELLELGWRAALLTMER